MRLQLRSRARAERCPYCHDALGDERCVECDACHAVYHAECVTLCVTLGCRGALKRAAPPPPKRWLSPLVKDALLATLIPYGMVCLGAVLAAGVLKLGAALALTVMFVGLVMLVVFAGGDRSRPTVVRTARPAVPTPAAATGDLDRANATLARAVGASDGNVEPPAPADAPPPTLDEVETRRRQQEALLARRRPPGLGRTV